MALEELPQKEVEEAIRYVHELRKDPEKYNRWLDTVLDRALKGWRSKRTWKGKARKTKHSAKFWATWRPG